MPALGDRTSLDLATSSAVQWHVERFNGRISVMSQPDPLRFQGRARNDPVQLPEDL